MKFLVGTILAAMLSCNLNAFTAPTDTKNISGNTVVKPATKISKKIQNNTNNETSIRKIASEIMHVPAKKIDLKKEHKGMTSAGSYSVSIDGSKYILKIFSKKQSTAARKKEIKSLQIFSDLKIGAKFLGNDKNNEGYILAYIEGTELKYKDVSDEKILKKLADAIKKLHDYKTGEQARSQLERAEKHYKRILRNKVALPSGYEEHYLRYKKEITNIKNDIVFCNNDLNPNNIILGSDGKIYFVDVTNSGNSNRFEDIGYLTMLNGIYGKNLEIFLEEYFGRKPTEAEITLVKKYQKFTCFLTSIVWFDFSESEKEKSTSYKDRVTKLDKMLKSDKIKTWK